MFLRIPWIQNKCCRSHTFYWVDFEASSGIFICLVASSKTPNFHWYMNCISVVINSPISRPRQQGPGHCRSPCLRMLWWHYHLWITLCMTHVHCSHFLSLSFQAWHFQMYMYLYLCPWKWAQEVAGSREFDCTSAWVFCRHPGTFGPTFAVITRAPTTNLFWASGS